MCDADDLSARPAALADTSHRPVPNRSPRHELPSLLMDHPPHPCAWAPKAWAHTDMCFSAISYAAWPWIEPPHGWETTWYYFVNAPSGHHEAQPI